MSIIIVCRQACGIDLGTSYVVTGGVYSDQRVSQYFLTGKMTRLPDLNDRRFDHACSQFVDNDGVTVRNNLKALGSRKETVFL